MLLTMFTELKYYPRRSGVFLSSYCVYYIRVFCKFPGCLLHYDLWIWKIGSFYKSSLIRAFVLLNWIGFLSKFLPSKVVLVCAILRCFVNFLDDPYHMNHYHGSYSVMPLSFFLCMFYQYKISILCVSLIQAKLQLGLLL